ncbi:hypothetical protein LV779_27930 [Streptomyces thinghirensis]|nr:hypothetical protein [Streptomyces thinghirensis]
MLVVEHDPDVIALADHVVDMGPGAGAGRRPGGVRGDAGRAGRRDTLTGAEFGRRTARGARTRGRRPRVGEGRRPPQPAGRDGGLPDRG